MSANDPREVARRALENNNDTPPNDGGSDGGNTDNNNGKQRGSNPLPLVLGIGFIAIVLISVGLFMLFGGQGDTVAEPMVDDDEVAAETAEDPAATTADLTALPPAVAAKGDVLVIGGDNAVTVPGGVQPADELYAWNGEEWVFVPSIVSGDGQRLLTVDELNGREAIIGERAAPTTVMVAADVRDAEEELPTELLPLLTDVNVGGLMLTAGGNLEGSPAMLPQGGYQQTLQVTNVGAIVDQAALSELLNDAGLRNAHIQNLVTVAETGGFSGINLDYQGVVPGQQAEFTGFVTELASALEENGMSLAVTLGTPTPVGDGTWDTGGQNWVAIGEAADMVYVQMPLDPTAYNDGGTAEQLLSWAVRQIDRAKLNALVSANAIDKLGGVMREVPLTTALGNFGELEMMSAEGESIEPGTAVELSLAGNASPLAWDGESLTYKYSYDDQNGQTRTVWIGNNAALSHRLRLAEKYHLNGAAVRGLSHLVSANGYTAALESYVNDAETPQPVGAAITWVVKNTDGGVVASESGEALSFMWEGTETAGNYQLEAGFAQGEVNVPLGAVSLVVGEPDLVAADEETAESNEEATEETLDVEEEEVAEAEAKEEVDEGDAEAEAEEAAPAASGDTNATVGIDSNVRQGPGIIYGTIAGGATSGTAVEVIGRSEDSLWLNIILPDGQEGWIFAELLNVDAAVDVAALPVPAVSASPLAAAPATDGGGDGGSSGGGGAAAPPAPVPSANLGGGFELGGQTHTLANPQIMQMSGMNWVKFQHKWGCTNRPTDVQGRIQQAQANGFKVLLSIPGSPYPSSIDFDCYVNFLGGVAALGPDAIEVWNEMNIDFEWPVGEIDPASYVNNMLAPAYNAIKSANPNVMVISGAPAPTGFFGGGCSANGCDDSAYLAGMAAAGAAGYMDCMGVHYNAGATSPTQTSGHPAGNNHYTWYLPTMIDTYYNALGKPLCITELGYLSGEDYGGLPSRFSWASNTTIAQHAQWLGQAVSYSANTGKVRMVIVFNVDFTLFDGADPQAGFAMIRKNGSCPACQTLAQAMGR